MSEIPDDIRRTADHLACVSGLATRADHIAKAILSERQRHADSVDKADAWDASQASWDKGYKRGQDDAAKAHAEVMEEVRKVLEPFAEEAAVYDPDTGDGDDVVWATPAYFRINHLRAARALLLRMEER